MAFDLMTHKRNKKGAVVSTNHYTLHIVNGVKKYERPKGSGIFYSEDGSLIASAPKEKPAPVKKEALKVTDADKEALNKLLDSDEVK